MSYDLTLFRILEGVNAELACQALMEQQERDSVDLDGWLKRPIPESARAEIRRLADVLKLWRPALEEFPLETPLPWIELNDQELQVQFVVYAGTVTVTMPYFRERVQEMMECATGCFEILKKAANYTAYDSQLGRVVLATDLDEMVEQYRRMDGALPEILAHHGQASATTVKPWWKIW